MSKNPYQTTNGGIIKAPHPQNGGDPKPISSETGGDLRSGK